MRSLWTGRNIRIIVAVATVTWVVCMCVTLGVGIWFVRYGEGIDLSAATSSPVTGTHVQLSPSEGYAGTELTVNGQNWRAGDVVFVRLQNQTGETDEHYAYAGAVADSTGQFSVSFIYPYDPRWLEGDFVQVVARAEASGMQATAPFRLVPPTVMPTPTQDATVTPTSTPVPVVPTPQPGMPTPSPTPLPPPPPEPVITEWRGAYFTNPNLQGQPAIIRNDREVNFEWGMGGPALDFPVDNFSAQWTRDLNFEGGNYRFYVRVDDGTRLWVDNQLVIDQWHDSGPVTYVADLYLTPGGHSIRMDYYERIGWAVAQLRWDRLQAGYPDWKGEYFDNPNLAGSPVLVRNDPWIDFNWGSGSPGPNVPSDNFSARWMRTWHFDAGDYRLYLKVDDGARLWIDDQLVIDQWHDSGPVTYTADRHLGSGDHRLRLEYYERVGNAEVHLWWERVEASYPDWKSEYFNNRHLQGAPVVVRNDARPDFNWGEGSPAPGVPSDNFSVRWTRNQRFDHSGAYRFYALVDDGARVWVGGEPVIDEWRNGSERTVSGTKWIDAGEQYVKVEYYDDSGNARITVWWEREQATSTPPPSPTPTQTSLPTASPTAIPTATSVPTGTVVPTVTTEPSEPSLALSPSQGGVGTPILVRGSHWPAGQSVALTFAQSQPGMTKIQIDPGMTVSTVTAGPDGAFETTVTLSEGQGWEAQPQALVVAYTADFSETSVTPFVITSEPAPTDTTVPTGEATIAPTPPVTEIPTEVPTEVLEPTAELTEMPVEPTAEPTEVVEPTVEPTQEIVEPTEMPAPPTEEPQPTEAPVVPPTEEPAPSQPIISLVPISGTVGITLTVHGEGWPVGAPVGFTLAQPVVESTPQFTVPLTETVQVNEQGIFDKFLWLPAGVGWENVPQTLVIARTGDGQFEVVAPYTVITMTEGMSPPAP